ncbi:MAG: hypothetical protein CL946_13010 [Ectothiorhodospiraceae bacterium]|nr:hypothetical protein [Ectothiorhodospiraceae bacterium]
MVNSIDDDAEILIVTTDTTSQGELVTMGFTNDKPALVDFVEDKYPPFPSSFGHDAFPHNCRDAVMYALRELAKQSGSKYCVVYTAERSLDYPERPYSIDVLQLVDRYDIQMNTISTMPFQNPPKEYDRELRRPSMLSGGQFIVLGPDQQNSITDTTLHLVPSILDSSCIITYTADNCTDSVRHIEIIAELSDGSTLYADTVVESPHRSDTLQLVVSSVKDEVDPPEHFHVYVRLEPRVDKQLPVSLSFLIKYDPITLRLDAPHIASNTILEDAGIGIYKVGDGVFKCELEYVYPAQESGNLIGLRFDALADSVSHPTFIALDSISFTAGCPNTVIAHPDTVYICVCQYDLGFEVQGEPILTGDEVLLPVVVKDTSIYGTTPLTNEMIFSTGIHFDPEYLTPIGVDGIGAMTEDARLEWRLRAPDTLEVRADEGFMPKDGRTLFYARFRVKQPKAAVESHLSVPYVRAFSDCCYGLEKTSTTSILIDGECEKIVRRAGEVTLAQNAPNPARGETSFRFTVHSKGALDGTTALLTLYRSDGKAIAELYNQPASDGEYTVPYSTADLPAGMYYVVLTIGKDSQTRSVVLE